MNKPKTFPKLLKFHGKFTDLIPYGFKFQKLFASNYRQYCLDVVEHCDTIRVWQAHGGYIEMNDWYSATKGVVEAVVKGNFKWHEYKKRPGIPFHCDSLGFTINRETSEVIPFVREKHDALYARIQGENDGKSDTAIENEIDEIYKNYRVERISMKMVNKIHEFHAKGWIQ